MAGKTNCKQIAVYKNKKALIEFMDDTRYEKDAMAWPHTLTSRIPGSLRRITARKRAMMQHGLANYFETVTNPILYYQLEEENS